MTDSNGDFYCNNLKKGSNEDSRNIEENSIENEEVAAANNRSREYVKELLAEKLAVDPHKHPNIIRLLEQEITNVQKLGRVPIRDNRYVDIYREKPIKVTVKVLVPVREHPKFNFVGKLLGPKGNSLKRLQEETVCKMAVLGRGSMKDRAKEQELRQSLDPKYSHLTEDLHVEISALGPPAEAHARIAFALAEVRKYLIPDSNDNIRQEQLREMEAFVEDPASDRQRRGPPKSILRASGVPPLRGPPMMRTATRVPVTTHRVMPAKAKIMSILDRARIAMEENYGDYDDLYAPSPPGYESYSSRPSYQSASMRDYDDYEAPDYYNRGGSAPAVYDEIETGDSDAVIYEHSGEDKNSENVSKNQPRTSTQKANLPNPHDKKRGNTPNLIHFQS